MKNKLLILLSFLMISCYNPFKEIERAADEAIVSIEEIEESVKELTCIIEVTRETDTWTKEQIAESFYGRYPNAEWTEENVIIWIEALVEECLEEKQVSSDQEV